MIGDLIGWFTHALPGGQWVLILAAIRILSVFAALLAISDVWGRRHVNRRSSKGLLVGLALLGCGQLIGALGVNQPTAVVPTPFALIVNIGAVVTCLSLYMRGVIRMRR